MRFILQEKLPGLDNWKYRHQEILQFIPSDEHKWSIEIKQKGYLGVIDRQVDEAKRYYETRGWENSSLPAPWQSFVGLDCNICSVLA